jgi:hypothetical protein
MIGAGLAYPRRQVVYWVHIGPSTNTVNTVRQEPTRGRRVVPSQLSTNDSVDGHTRNLAPLAFGFGGAFSRLQPKRKRDGTEA